MKIPTYYNSVKKEKIQKALPLILDIFALNVRKCTRRLKYHNKMMGCHLVSDFEITPPVSVSFRDAALQLHLL